MPKILGHSYLEQNNTGAQLFIAKKFTYTYLVLKILEHGYLVLKILRHSYLEENYTGAQLFSAKKTRAQLFTAKQYWDTAI